MRRAHDDAYDGTVQWGEWASQDRAVAAAAAMKNASVDGGAQTAEPEPDAKPSAEADGPLDTTIAGPWMRTWPLVHGNRHTATLSAESSA